MTTPPPDTNRFQVQADAILFGFPTVPAALTVRANPIGWRASMAAATMGAFVVLAAVAAIVPPHAPWLLGALVTGAILARRRWIERFTLERVEGECPKCGEPFSVKSGRLRTPHPLTCEACHHECSLRVPPEALERRAPSDG